MSQAQKTQTTALPTLGKTKQQQQASPGFLRVAWRRFRRDKVSMAALIMLLLICLIVLAAPLFTQYVLQYDPNRGVLRERFQAPSRSHLLGTDDFGRDTLARVLHAGRVSLQIAVMVVAIGMTIGVATGLLAGYFGGKVDDVINVLVQLIVSIPLLFILILLAVLFRPTPTGLALIFGLTTWPNITRLVRGRVLSERRRDYVDAAIVAGARPGRIMFQHIMPNVASIILVVAGFEAGAAILGEAGLSALGFGVQVPTASWGNMLSKALDHINRAWWLVIAPGIAILLTTFSIFLVADGLRDAFDPRLKR